MESEMMSCTDTQKMEECIRFLNGMMSLTDTEKKEECTILLNAMSLTNNQKMEEFTRLLNEMMSWTYNQMMERCTSLLKEVNFTGTLEEYTKLLDEAEIATRTSVSEGKLLILLVEIMLANESSFDVGLEWLHKIIESLITCFYNGFKNTLSRILRITFNLIQTRNPVSLNVLFKDDLLGCCQTYDPLLRIANDTKFVITCNNNKYRLGEYLVAAILPRTDYLKPFIEWPQSDREFCTHFYYINEILLYGVNYFTDELDSARIKCEDTVGDVTMTQHCLGDLLIFCLVAYCKMHNKEGEEYYHGDFKIEKEAFKESINLLLRAVPHVSGKYIKQRCKPLGFRRTNVLNAVKLVKKHIPEFRNRFGRVAKLLHLSRYAIRQVLYLNWALPTAITELEIPGPLKNYLYLERGVP